mmetsp:Transcript_45141/g.119363  ORF Transcript_45141/g.119363 Transcript_45141/m.119363 type:complete len:539 (-) Transcript_45141:150-1766(-)
MQTEAQLHPVLRDPLQEAWVFSVLSQHPRLVDLRQHPDKRRDGQVGELPLSLPRRARQAPDQQETVADVLVGGAVIIVDATVNYLTDLIDEDHDLLLKHLRRICEVPDVAETDDGVDLLPRHHGVDPRRPAAHVLPDDLGARLSEAEGQEAAELDDRLLEDDRLHRLLHLFEVVALVKQLHAPAHSRKLLLSPGVLDLLAAELDVAELHRVERVVLDCLHLRDHPLDRVEQELVCIAGEGHRPDADCEADEYRLQDAQARAQLCRSPAVEQEHHRDMVALPLRVGERDIHPLLRAPQLLLVGAQRRGVVLDLRRDCHTYEVATPFDPWACEFVADDVWQGRVRGLPALIDEGAVPVREPVRGQHVGPQEPLLVEPDELAEVAGLGVGVRFEAYPVEAPSEVAEVVVVDVGEQVLLVPSPLGIPALRQLVARRPEALQAPRRLPGPGVGAVRPQTPLAEAVIDQLDPDVARGSELVEAIRRGREQRHDEEHDQHEDDDTPRRHVRQLFADPRLRGLRLRRLLGLLRHNTVLMLERRGQG